jgi:GNAT superfamily N-acetyltransferase
VTIRPAGDEDAVVVAALRRAWVEETAGGTVEDDAYDETFAEWFDREGGHRVMWLAEVDGQPVGMLNVMVFTRMPRPGVAASRWGYVSNVFVLAGHRDSGIGARLLEACTSYADEQRFVRLVLSPSERSVSLYGQVGFGPATSLLLRPGPEG